MLKQAALDFVGEPTIWTETMRSTPPAKGPECCWRRTFWPMIIYVVAGW
jgi:hypothetical protein